MSSATTRFIWNSRYFHIAKAGEKLSDFAVSGDYASGLVEYVGTRETVALNIADEYKDKPATEKQIKLIDDLCRSVPDYKNHLEYEDYKKTPTMKNASEFISILSEELIMHGEFNEAANLIEYAAKRPGAVKVGAHGLFGAEDDIDLKQAQSEVSEHDGNIWTHVLSLRREDADRLGYDNQESWKSLVKSNLTEIAEAHNIKLANMRWYAAMHNTSYHPHIHLFVFSDNPKEGFFSNKGKNDSIEKCKRAFATKIFAADLENEYVAKTEYREELKTQTKELLDQLSKNTLGYYSEDTQKELVKKLITLSNSIASDKDVKYGYLKSELKELVNDIQKQLVYSNEKLSQLYMKWCEHQFNIEKTYITEPTQVPIEENNEFIPIKNYIIKVAQSLHNGFDVVSGHENIDTIKKAVSLTSSFSEQYYLYPENDIKSNEDTFKELFSKSTLESRDGDICCKLADCYNYGIGTEKDVTKAMMWYGISSDQYHNGVAAYRLAEIYEKTPSEESKELAQEYYQQAYYDLKYCIKNWECFDAIENNKEFNEFYKSVSKNDAFKEFLIGRLYYEGKGVEQDYLKAFNSFLIASENGNNSAKHYIGDMCMKGIGVSQNETIATEYLTDCAYTGNRYAAYSLYKHFSDNTQIASLANTFLELAAKNGHPMAQVKFAKIECEKGNINEAVRLYESAAKQNIADANYNLGNIFNNPEYSEYYNSQKAQQFYQKAFEGYMQDYNKSPNGYLAYNIANMYHNGHGVKQDFYESIKWYQTAAEENGCEYQQEIESAQQQINISLGSIVSTVMHMGRTFRNNTLNSNKKRYTPDKKTARQERERKIRAGQAQDDYDSYDYNY